MIQIRYPNITGATPEERQKQMESHMRYLVDQLNWAIKNNQKSVDEEKKQQTPSNESGKIAAFDKKLEEHNKKIIEISNRLSSYWDIVYPVGAVYVSVSEINPSILFGGTWTQIEDRFLLAAGSTYAAGATGGEANHILTENEMPSHNHNPGNYNTAGSEAEYKRQFTTNLHTSSTSTGRMLVAKSSDSGIYAMIATTSSDITGVDYTTNTGGDKAHNNMPPYLVVYVWKRIS